MAGAVSVEIRVDYDDAIKVSPSSCPAREAHWPYPYCLLGESGGIISTCPFMYGSQGRYKGLWVRHAGAPEFASDCRDNLVTPKRVRVLCLRAEHGSLEPGARLWGINPSAPHGIGDNTVGQG